MRICFVANFSGEKNTGDMGTKAVARNLAHEASKRHEVLRIDVNAARSWKAVRDFEPDLFHFVLSPTTFGFFAAKLWSMLSRPAKFIVSAPNPTLLCKWLISRVRPDLVLMQALDSEQMFQRLGFATRYLPNGVDVDRFVPVSQKMREKYRADYQLDRDTFIVLHVGPIIRKRNIEQLLALRDDDCQILIVGRKGGDPRLRAELEKKGARVITEYVSRIEQIYACSDCYVFPTDPRNKGASIEMPLSVLESMACGLPTVSTPFGALPRVFDELHDIIFFNDVEEMRIKVNNLRSKTPDFGTRELVSQYSWELIGERLECIYNELLSDTH